MSSALSVLALMMMFVLFLAALRPALVGSGPGLHVVDGDTLDHAGERWRLVGFDAPEIFRVGCARERHAGILAAANLIALIERGPADLEALPGRDKWGRRLARLRIGGQDVADMMIAAGHARPYDGGKRKGWC